MLLFSHFSFRASEFLDFRILSRVSSSGMVSDFADSLSVYSLAPRVSELAWEPPRPLPKIGTLSIGEK